MKDKVKYEREKRKLTQQELADRVGVARTVITMIETDDNYRPSVVTAKKIAAELDLNWTNFFED